MTPANIVSLTPKDALHFTLRGGSISSAWTLTQSPAPEHNRLFVISRPQKAGGLFPGSEPAPASLDVTNM